MSFYISLSGLKGAQTDLSTISNNVANVASTSFKKSRANFGDIFAAAPMQSATTAAGQGTRLIGVTQQFTQGTLETTDKTLDLAITGEGFFTVKGAPPTNQVTYTRNGAFGVDQDRYVVDTLGNRVQLLPVDDYGKVAANRVGDLFDLRLPVDDGKPIPASPYIAGSATINQETGFVTVSFANGTTKDLRPAVTLPQGNYETDPSPYRTGSATINKTTGVVTVGYEDGTTRTLAPAVKLPAYNASASPLSYASVSDAGVVTAHFVDGSTQEVDTVTIPSENLTPSPLVSAVVADDGTVTATFADGTEKFIGAVGIPTDDGGTPASPLSSLSIDQTGLVSATFANGTTQPLGTIAMAIFPSQEGLRQQGSAHWTATKDSGEATYGGGNSGMFGEIRSGALERSNVDITEELVALISAQRNFQASAKAIEAASNMTQTVVNLRG